MSNFKSWAVPLNTVINDADLTNLSKKTKVLASDVPASLKMLLASITPTPGDLFIFLNGANVCAIGTFLENVLGGYSWNQLPIQPEIPCGLLVIPEKIEIISDLQLKNIWDRFLIPNNSHPNYWRISPGKGAIAWNEWKQRGIAAIGWPKLGDISKTNKDALRNHIKSSGYEDDSKGQVSSFKDIQPGDRIIANQGKTRVVGIGTVMQEYQFIPGAHQIINKEDYPHQIKVRWDITTAYNIPENNWVQALMPIKKDKFEEILSYSTKNNSITMQQSHVVLCAPENIILYGPPGTGKTYHTTKLALQLILGVTQVNSLTQEEIIRKFQELQSSGQIEFVTFHQSYGYEEFVEGIRPVLRSDTTEGIQYRLIKGIFKNISLLAMSKGIQIKAEDPSFDELWNLLLTDISTEEPVVKSQDGNIYQLNLSVRGSTIEVRPCKLDQQGNAIEIGEVSLRASKESVRLFWDFRSEIGPDPKDITYEKTKRIFARERETKENHQYTPQWLAYYRILELSQNAIAKKQDIIDPIARAQQALNPNGAAPPKFSFSNTTPQYVLIIDEINRGNISKIFG